MKEINKEIEKTFTEADSVMGILWQEIEKIIKLWQEADANSPNHQIKKGDIEKRKEDIKTRLNHLFDNSQPAPNAEKELSYSFYELKEILTKIVNGLPGLVNEKGEMNQKLLTPLVNVSEALEKLKNGEEKRVIIPGKLDNEDSYELVKKSESDELREKLILLEAAEEERKKQVLGAGNNTEKELENSREKIKSLEELKNQLLEEIKVLTGEEKEEVGALEKWLATKKKKLERLSKLGSEGDNNEVKSGKLSELTEENTRLQQQIFDLQKQLSSKSTSPKTNIESEAKKKIQAELDKFNNLKIENMSDKECFDLLDTFKTMKDWIFSDNEEESEAAMSKKFELKAITNTLDLEAYRREWKQDINDALKDEDEEEEERIVLTSTNLTEVDYIDFETTLKDKTSKKEMDDFGYKVIKDIYEQREKHERIIEVLSKGENALKNKNIKNAKEVLLYLELLEKLPGQKQVFSSNKRIEINRMRNRINSLINQQAQIVQNTK